MDRGFYRRKSVEELCENKITFIMGTKMSLSYVKKAMSQLLELMEQFQNYDVVHRGYAQSIQLNHEFKAAETAYYPMTLHIYYDAHRASDERESFNKQLVEWQILAEKDPATFDAQKEAGNYLTREGQSIKVNHDAIKEKKARMGYFALLSNSSLSSSEVLDNYRRKDIVEKAFSDIKDRLNMRRVKVFSNRSLEGKLFVQHLALILIAYIQREMKESQLNKTYTMEDILIHLNRIEGYWDEEFGLTIGEILEKQEEIYRGLKIAPPV